jgi:spore maturation protein SpmB
LPVILIAIFFVNIIKTIGIIDLISNILSPIFTQLGLSTYATLPIITKFLAGGTAMMGVTMDMINQGMMTANELNKLAGLIVNPFDPVGVAVLISAGQKTAGIIKPAIYGTICGIILKTILHLIIF